MVNVGKYISPMDAMGMVNYHHSPPLGRKIFGSLFHGVVNIPLFTGFYTSQVVVWDFFHQQYYKLLVFFVDILSKITMLSAASDLSLNGYAHLRGKDYGILLARSISVDGRILWQ